MVRILKSFLLLTLLSSQCFAATHIIGVGDSITAGQEDDVAPYAGYLDHLAALVGSDYDFIGPRGTAPYNHMAIGGYRTDQIEDLISDWLIEYVSPSDKNIFLIHLGTNDLAQSIDQSTAIGNIDDIIALILAYDSDSYIVVANITPRTGSDQDSAITAFNTALTSDILAKRASNRRIGVAYINQYFKTFSDWKTVFISADSVHPLDAGYTAMSISWYQAITRDTVGINGATLDGVTIE